MKIKAIIILPFLFTAWSAQGAKVVECTLKNTSTGQEASTTLSYYSSADDVASSDGVDVLELNYSFAMSLYGENPLSLGVFFFENNAVEDEVGSLGYEFTGAENLGEPFLEEPMTDDAGTWGTFSCKLVDDGEPEDTITLTAAIWGGFSEEKRQEILRDPESSGLLAGYQGFKVIKFRDLRDLATIHYRPYRQYISAALATTKNEISTEEIEQSIGSEMGFAIVGAPKTDVLLLTLTEGHIILGAHIDLFQKGAHKNDASSEDEFSFATPEEARAAGFDTDADVSWSASAELDQDAGIYPGDNFYEWTGW